MVGECACMCANVYVYGIVSETLRKIFGPFDSRNYFYYNCTERKSLLS